MNVVNIANALHTIIWNRVNVTWVNCRMCYCWKKDKICLFKQSPHWLLRWDIIQTQHWFIQTWTPHCLYIYQICQNFHTIQSIWFTSESSNSLIAAWILSALEKVLPFFLRIDYWTIISLSYYRMRDETGYYVYRIPTAVKLFCLNFPHYEHWLIFNKTK